jgi:hypothetical protein
VLQQQTILLTRTIEGKLIHGLKGYRKLEEDGEGLTSLPTSAPTGAPTSPAPATGGPTTSPPTSAPSIQNNGVAIGFSFGSANTSASVSSTGGGMGSAFGTSHSQGYSSSFVEIPSGATAMTNNSAPVSAQADASVDGDDQSPSSDYSNEQNSIFEASISVTNGTIYSINTTAVEDLVAVPFLEIFGGFGAAFGGANPDESTSDTSLPGEDASDGGTSDTETIKEAPFVEIFGGFGAFYGGANPDEPTFDTSISAEDASDSGTSDTETKVEEESNNATASTSHSEGGYYGSFGASP